MHDVKKFNLIDTFCVLCIVGLMSLLANYIGYKHAVMDALPGMLVLMAIAIIGMAMGAYLPGNIPSVAYVVTLGCILTYPAVPGSAFINESMKTVNFLALTTPILAYAGIAIGRDLDALKKSGWRIIVVSFVVFTGTYVGSAIIAQLILKYLGQI